MKTINTIILIIGIFLMLGTESENATTNIIGFLLVVYECNKLNLFDDGKSNRNFNVA